MPDYKQLKIGDKIQLLSVPEADLKYRVYEIQNGVEMAGWTADTIERIIEQNPVVSIIDIDDYGSPWYTAEIKGADGEIEVHELSISENDSWKHFEY